MPRDQFRHREVSWGEVGVENWARHGLQGQRSRGAQAAAYSSAWALPRNLLLPRGVQAERPWARLRVRVYRAEGLPTVRSGLLGSLTRALHDQHVLLDPYVRVSFLGQQVSHPCPPRPQLEPFKKYLLIKDNLS